MSLPDAYVRRTITHDFDPAKNYIGVDAAKIAGDVNTQGWALYRNR
jgi:hypothetical protein